MRFTLPQFIEFEPKIVGPLTFKQFIFIGIAGAICLFLFFTLGKTNFFLFITACFIIVITAISLAFLKIGGRGLPTVFGNFVIFIFSSRIFLWKKKEVPVIVFKKEEMKKEEVVEEGLPLKIAEKSQLKKLHTQIETKTK